MAQVVLGLERLLLALQPARPVLRTGPRIRASGMLETQGRMGNSINVRRLTLGRYITRPIYTPTPCGRLAL